MDERAKEGRRRRNDEDEKREHHAIIEKSVQSGAGVRTEEEWISETMRGLSTSEQEDGV
jgi:hypothetical protein